MFTVTPASLSFAPQVVDTTSTEKSVTITNPSTEPQKVQPLTFIANDFGEVANSCPSGAQDYLLAPGASCIVTFDFVPTNTGTLSATVDVTLTPDGLPGQTITLTGTGTVAGAQPAVITQPYICLSGVCRIGAQFVGNIAGNFFATQLSATGGTAPYTWSGQAPAGLTLQSDGVIVGTFPSPSTSIFTVMVTDATGASATATLSLTTVAPDPSNCQTGVGNLTESLSGPELNGQAPSGIATLTDNDGNEDCATSLLAQVSGVNLPDGTELWITYDNYPVGTITLNDGSGGMTPFGFPNTAYGLDQVRVYTSFPSSTTTPILQGTLFTIQSS